MNELAFTPQSNTRKRPAGIQLVGLIMLSALIGLAGSGASEGVWSVAWGNDSGDRQDARFIAAFTNDDGRVDSSSKDPLDDGTDPGYDKPVAVCRAWKVDADTVRVKGENGYPSYTCRFWVKVRNPSSQPIERTSLEVWAPPELTVSPAATDSGPVIWPYEWTYEAFTVHVEQSAEQNRAYGIEITLTFAKAKAKT